MRLRSIVAAVGLVVAALVAPAAAALAQSIAVDRPAEIRHGTCANLGDVVESLAPLMITEGESQGQAGATPVEQSGTVIPYVLDDFLQSDHAIVVMQAPEDDVFVSCGEVGGAINPDGTLAIGMRDMNGSGLSGVAYFTPIYEVDSVLVTILLVGETGGGDHSLGVDQVVSAAEGITDTDGLDKSSPVDGEDTAGT
jgi:hypothetical protein